MMYGPGALSREKYVVYVLCVENLTCLCMTRCFNLRSCFCYMIVGLSIIFMTCICCV